MFNTNPSRLTASALLASLLFTSTAVAAKLQPLASVTNDRNQDKSQLSAIVSSEGDVEGLHFETKHADGRPPLAKNFSVAQIGSSSGVVVVNEGSHKAVILHGRIDERSGDGQLVLSYLSNGLLGRYKQCELGLRRNSKGRMEIVNAYTGSTVKRIAIKTWSMGIETVQGICP